MSCLLYDLKSGNSGFVINTTIFSHTFVSTKGNESNEPMIVQIGQLEAEIFGTII